KSTDGAPESRVSPVPRAGDEVISAVAVQVGGTDDGHVVTDRNLGVRIQEAGQERQMDRPDVGRPTEHGSYRRRRAGALDAGVGAPRRAADVSERRGNAR